MTDSDIAKLEEREFTQAELERINAAEEQAGHMAAGVHLDQWIELGEVLLMGRRFAMRQAFVNRPEGRGYNEAFGHWLRRRPNLAQLFIKPDGRVNSLASDLQWIVDNAQHRQILIELRQAMTAVERARLNSPSTARKKNTEVLRARQAEQAGEQPPPATQTAKLKAENAKLKAEVERLEQASGGSLFDLAKDSGRTIGEVLAETITEHKWSEIRKAADAVFGAKRKRGKPAG